MTCYDFCEIICKHMNKKCVGYKVGHVHVSCNFIDTINTYKMLSKESQSMLTPFTAKSVSYKSHYFISTKLILSDTLFARVFSSGKCTVYGIKNIHDFETIIQHLQTKILNFIQTKPKMKETKKLIRRGRKKLNQSLEYSF